ncbi:MAG TPA: sigma-70 family RNA polymerase sigma factor [Chloroflexi bacterium]|nr:sigma-70 family RNA polymerase sigma factor [Chloroflexota bacterium]
MCEESDAVLIARAKEDPEAFGALYERYVKRIYNYIYYRTNNHHEAEDLTARTFLQALKNLARYKDRGAPYSAYLYRIAHNLVANWYRARSRKSIVSIEHVANVIQEPDCPVARAEKKEHREVLLQAVRQLAPDRQQLLILKFGDQMSNTEIGAVMERTEGAIKSLYHRTLVELREKLISADSETNRTLREDERWTTSG